MQGGVALITGGSSGIGLATALAFAEREVKIVIASRDEKRGNEALKTIRAAGGDAIWVQADVAQSDQVQALVQKTLDHYGRLDYAFNNGGSGGQGGWLAELPEDAWDKTINGFLTSVYLCMKYELIEMLKAGKGVIVNNSSVDGLRAFPWDAAYSAAKHGVIGLTKSTAVQYADKNIRINAVCPSWIKTPPIEDMLRRNPDSEKGMLMHQPIGRFGQPEEVAQAVVWLCSDAASFIIGAAMGVDGGYLAV